MRSSGWSCTVLAAVFAALLGSMPAASGAAASAESSLPSSSPRTGEWNFSVTLDGSPIGEHRFRLEPDGEQGRLTSEARFDVKVLGFTAYRYRHSAVERWRGGCLTSLVATTDDDGTPSQVRIAATDEPAARAAAATSLPDGCVMSFAYWHPAMRTQTRLLNAQTGKLETVQVQRLPDARMDVRGDAVACRVAGATRPVNVWYAADGQWVGLDAVVGDGRKLSYRLR